jgi:GDP-L-fucose synthase
MYNEDMADACVFLLENIDFKDIIEDKISTLPNSATEIRNTHINIGTGVDISIKELAQLIQEIVGYKGKLKFDITKPDGTILKLTDPSKLDELGWRYKTNLEDGIRLVYEWYKNKA